MRFDVYKIYIYEVFRIILKGWISWAFGIKLSRKINQINGFRRKKKNNDLGFHPFSGLAYDGYFWLVCSHIDLNLDTRVRDQPDLVFFFNTTLSFSFALPLNVLSLILDFTHKYYPIMLLVYLFAIIFLYRFEKVERNQVSKGLLGRQFRLCFMFLDYFSEYVFDGYNQNSIFKTVFGFNDPNTL